MRVDVVDEHVEAVDDVRDLLPPPCLLALFRVPAGSAVLRRGAGDEDDPPSGARVELQLGVADASALVRVTRTGALAEAERVLEPTDCGRRVLVGDHGCYRLFHSAIINKIVNDCQGACFDPCGAGGPVEARVGRTPPPA